MDFKAWLKIKEDLGGAALDTPTPQYDQNLSKGLAKYKPPVDTKPKTYISKRLDKLFGKPIS